MSTYVHHPECVVQNSTQPHEPTDESQGACYNYAGEEIQIFPDWPKDFPDTPVAEAAPQPTEEAIPAAQPAEGGLGPSTEAQPATAAPQPVPAVPAGVTTSAHEWKLESKTTELTVPSGHVCLAKKPGGMSMFLQKGMIPNGLLPIIKGHMNDGRQVDMEKVGEEMLDDPSKINDILELCDSVVLHTVVQPRVAPTPRFTEDDSNHGRIPSGYNVGDVMPEECRDSNTLYVDEVDIEDKMFVFQWAVGGTRDIATFRSEQASALADLPTVE